MLRIGGVKLFLDGGTCGPAAVSEVVKSNDGMGTLFLSDGELAQIVRRADSAGYQIAIHALGDRAVDQAMDTLNLFREDEVGSLKPGKLADLIVLSGNPLDNPGGSKDLSVLVTVVGGKTEFCATGQEALCP